jgi:hypothetical protein
MIIMMIFSIKHKVKLEGRGHYRNVKEEEDKRTNRKEKEKGKRTEQEKKKVPPLTKPPLVKF